MFHLDFLKGPIVVLISIFIIAFTGAGFATTLMTAFFWLNLRGAANAMKKMHHNARRLVKKFYDASKNNGKKLPMAKRR